MHGQIESKPSDGGSWILMEPGDCFYAGDAVRAGHDSQAVLLFICPGYGKFLANLYADTTITFMPAVLKEYFANRHYVKDDLDVIGIDPAALARTPNDSQTEE